MTKASAPAQALIEIIKAGGALRVAAVDPATGVEVVFVAPQTAARSDIEALALAKLARALGAADDLAGTKGAATGARAPRTGLIV